MQWYRFRKVERERFARDLGSLGRVVKTDGTVEITLTPEALEAIELKAREVHESAPGLTLNNLRIGLTGQAAVFSELGRSCLEGVNQMRIGASDEYDILYRGFRDEIKTFDIRNYKPYNPSGIEANSLMAVKTTKFHERIDAFYTGCLYVSNDKIEIMGFLTRKEMMLLDEDHAAHENYSGWKYAESYNPDDDCIVVRKRSQFTSITSLDSVIDEAEALKKS